MNSETNTAAAQLTRATETDATNYRRWNQKRQARNTLQLYAAAATIATRRRTSNEQNKEGRE